MASGLFSPGPYHIIAYGTLLGTSFFHSFINGPTMYRVLDRPRFSAVQSALFPIYFGMQTALPAVLALTYPGSGGVFGGPAGLAGVLMDPDCRWDVLLPIATMAIAGLANLTVLLPAVSNCMERRRAQEDKDGKKSYDPQPHSAGMKALNGEFGRLHGISSLLNLATLAAAVGYGFTLGEMLGRGGV